ncbi:MAG: DUF433 domain-containing protein [Candidatus Coatesbacteria bacterium]|nr:DUF433 domain-containing protein [Candidatus Coatesbacteria bacterium]
MSQDWAEYIVSMPDVLRGNPRIDGTRITVSLILGYLGAGNLLRAKPFALWRDSAMIFM